MKNIARLRKKYGLVVILLDNLACQSTNGRIVEEGKCLISLNRMALVGAEPPLPNNIAGLLNSLCPFWRGRQVRDTHLLVLIPSQVTGQPLALDYLGQLIERPYGGGRTTKYGYYWDDVREAIGTQSADSSYWVLMTRDVLPGSRYRKYTEQCALVKLHQEYTPPEIFEAATALLLYYVMSGERLYSDNPETYTRCLAKDVSGKRLVVGGFSPCKGLTVGLIGFKKVGKDRRYGMDALKRWALEP